MCERMRGRKIGERGSSSRGMYIRNIADIIPNWSDICSTADIPEINKISPLTLRNFAYLADMRFSSLTQTPSALRISAVPLCEIMGV